jgi:protein-S-isoprenylcysteine O-methyltransferase Ste14
LLPSACILVGVRPEEHDLVEKPGATYRNHRERRPMLLPLAKLGRSGAVRGLG